MHGSLLRRPNPSTELMRTIPDPSDMENDPADGRYNSAADGAVSAWRVYLVQCVDGTFYTGITTDPQRRLRQHNGELVGGARYTRPRRPVVLVYQEHCRDRSHASQREAAVRKLSRWRKQALARAQ